MLCVLRYIDFFYTESTERIISQREKEVKRKEENFTKREREKREDFLHREH